MGAAKALLSKPSVTTGFERLWLEKRLDLTVEALALNPKFADLFTSEELATVERRLRELGVDPKDLYQWQADLSGEPGDSRPGGGRRLGHGSARA